jgi:type IV pilus assembly protein PilC
MADQPIKLAYQTAHLLGDPTWRSIPLSWPRRVFAWVVSNLFWMTMAAILVGVCTATASSAGSPALGFPTLLTIVMGVPMIAIAADRVRRRRLTAALGYLQQAFRLNLPFNRILAAAARSETERLRKELLFLNFSLEAGAPISAALSRAFPAMRPRTAGLIEYAEHTGRLPQTIDRLIREDLGESRQVRENRVMTTWYPPLLLLITSAVVGIIGIFAIPKLEATFMDFHLQVPPITHLIFEYQQWLTFPVAVMVLLLWPVWAARFRESMRPRRSTELFRDVRDRIAWAIPVYRGILRERAMADVCSSVADALEWGFPLNQSLDRLEALDLNLVMRRRVQKWNQGLSRGLCTEEAADEARLPRFFVGMLGTARASRDLPDVLRFVARYYRDRFVLYRELLRAAYLPAVTLLMGVVVAAVALGLFLPLTKLIFSMGTSIRRGL